MEMMRQFGEERSLLQIRWAERSGHLMEQPMIGGDKATYYPLRMVVGILYNKVDRFENFIYDKLHYFPDGNKEVEILFDEIIKTNNNKFKATMTTVLEEF